MSWRASMRNASGPRPLLDTNVLLPTHLGWLEGNELFGLFWTLAG